MMTCVLSYWEITLPHIGAQNKLAGHEGHGIYYRFKLFLIGDIGNYAVDNVNAICARSCAISLGPIWGINDVNDQPGT